MRFVWKCDRGHPVVKKAAERRELRGEKRWFVFCDVCKAVKPISREMKKCEP